MSIDVAPLYVHSDSWKAVSLKSIENRFCFAISHACMVDCERRIPLSASDFVSLVDCLVKERGKRKACWVLSDLPHVSPVVLVPFLLPGFSII